MIVERDNNEILEMVYIPFVGPFVVIHNETHAHVHVYHEHKRQSRCLCHNSFILKRGSIVSINPLRCTFFVPTKGDYQIRSIRNERLEKSRAVHACMQIVIIQDRCDSLKVNNLALNCS